jgi:hypothetical protein
MEGRRMSNVYSLLQAEDAKAQVAAHVEADRPFEARALAREKGVEEAFVDDLIKVQNEKARLKLRDAMAAVMAEPPEVVVDARGRKWRIADGGARPMGFLWIRSEPPAEIKKFLGGATTCRRVGDSYTKIAGGGGVRAGRD